MAVIKKTPAEIEAMKEAGRLSAAVLREVGARCVPGVTTLELDEFAEDYIRSHGGIPTFKGYGGFPGSICASINEQVVHGIPSSKVKLQSGDIISIDVGATVDGWAGDNAWTYAVGTVSTERKRLLEQTEKSMWAGISAARVGNRLGDIGHAVQSVAKQANLGVVRAYTGHGIGRDMHEDPNVPNYGMRHTGMKLETGMVLAIEPMLTLGTYKVRVMPDGWLVVTNDGKPAAHFEKTVAITESGPVLVSVEPDHKRPVN
ncbi:MAG: type I methionyl aminopeptidase [Eggerthellaceae bacterium]|nr:type I methionyl aminopeptidase [Eggerthellaceae bacterium]